MRASVTMNFKHPVTKVRHRKGDVLRDAELEAVLADPELKHRVSVSDRTPARASAPTVDAAASVKE